MDLSRFKWPIIILVVIGGVWLITDPGVSYMHKNLLKNTPGADAAKDKATEAGLSRLGGFLLKTFRYKKGFDVFADALRLYPNGANALYNRYRQAKCLEKLGDIKGSIAILRELQASNAHALNENVPEPANLKLRADKLMEMHGLGEVKGN